MRPKVSRSPSYLVRNPYSYCFRMLVPKDLQPYIGKKELRYSLKTGYLSEAKYKARIMAGQVQRVFKLLRKGKSLFMNLTDEQIQELVQKYFKKFVEMANQPFPPSYMHPEMQISPFADQAEFNTYLGDHDDFRRQLVLDRAMGEFDFVKEKGDKLLKENGIDEIDEKSPGYWKLCHGFMLAEIKIYDMSKKRLLAEYEEGEFVLQPPELSFQPRKQKSDTLSQAANDYWNEYSDGWKPRSKDDYKICLDHIVDKLGAETQIHTLDYMAMKNFRDGLKSGELSKSGKPLSVSRINFHLGTAKAMFDLAMKKDKHLINNPADGLRLKETRRADEKQDIFSNEDLEKLFCRSPEYGQDKHRNAHSFWIPLIALYTGARIEEICQLLITDIKQINGYWCLDINEDDAPDLKSVKMGEKRIVPLHSFLVKDLKFINYVESIKNKGEIRVFSKLKRVQNKWHHAYGQRFGKFKNRCGIVAPSRKKTFHSFRHTLIDFCKQNDIEEKHVQEFVGHKNRKITYGVYGKLFNPEKLYKKIVSKLKYNIDLSHLKSSKFVIQD